MTKLSCLCARFLRDERGSVQPEIVALTVSAMLLGVTYLETQAQQETNPPVKEEVYVRACGDADDGKASALASLRSRTYCR